MNRRTAIVIVCAAIACGVSAMADDFELLRPEHPRLELTSEQIAKLRADPDAVAAARALGDDIIARTRTTIYQDYFVSLPKPDFPPEHDDGWPYWTGLCGELRRCMEGTARAWVLTGERKYLAWCRDLMLAVAGWRQWTDPWYGRQPCLDTHHLTRGMCVAVDLLWHDLPDRDRATIVAAIAEKGAQFIFEHGNDETSYVSAPGAWPNGYAMINTELGVAGLTLLGEDERAQAWLRQALDKTRRFFDEQGGIDGGLVEGFGYGSAAVDNLMYLVRKADAIAGLNLFDNRYLSQAIYFPAYFVVPGGGSVANFGDNGGPEGCSPTLLDMARALVEVEASPVAAWYLRRAGQGGPEIDALARPPTDLPLARHFRDIDWVAMRSGWGDSGSLLAFKSGHVAHHNHLDQNSFILAWDDRWLLTDPGYQVYDMAYPPEKKLTREMVVAQHEYTYGTLGHNAILVDGRGQEPVRGHVTGFATTAAMDYAVGDASQCYPGLSRWLRHVVSVAPEYYVVFDEIATDGQRRQIELLLHTSSDGEFSVGGRPLPVGERREAAEATVTRGGEAVVCFVEPKAMLFEHRRQPHCEAYGHYLSASPGAMGDGTIAWVLAAGPRGRVRPETRPAECAGGTAVQVRTEGGIDTVAISPKHNATVGEISFAGAAAMVRESRAGAPHYGLVDGTSLTLGEATLIAGSAPVSAGAVIEPGLFRATITCAEAAEVTLHCPVEPGMMRVGGVEGPVDVRFDPDAATMTLDLPAGSYRIEVRAL